MADGLSTGIPDSTYGRSVSQHSATPADVCAHNTSEIRLVNCTIRSLVVARERSTILLRDCRIHGDVLAADTATVKLVGCTVDGQVERDPGATLIRE